jgi:hypothetical protein
VAGVACEFVDVAFVMVWGGVVSLLFLEVFYRIGAFECYSCVGVYKNVSNFAYLWVVICEGCPYLLTVISFLWVILV